MIAALPLAAITVASAAQAAPARSFSEAQVRSMARDLARRPYVPQSRELPEVLSRLSYDEYRDIRFNPAQAYWKAEGLPFQLQFFHRGHLFKERVDLFEVQGGRAVPIAYSADQFNFKKGAPAGLPSDLGFAGFRIHSQINTPEYYDEVAVFLGASYFRAVAKGMLYGLSARGLAIGAGEKEEFPSFKTFWIERPARGANSLVIHALMDSPSCAGAYRFVVTPGVTTVFDVRCRIFARKTIANIGVAPLTSMFFFAGDATRRFDDFRPRVHDSDGLAIANGAGERIWRPLSNPGYVQLSDFRDKAPRGYGLIQRERRYDSFQDLEARYERRPSLWVEPKGSWGAGHVRLVELPTQTEFDDNIVAFWTPQGGVKAGRSADFAYRLNWGQEPLNGSRARVIDTRAGLNAITRRRHFVIDFDLPPGVPVDDLRANVIAGAGKIHDVTLHSNPETKGARLSFELDPRQVRTVELRAEIVRSGRPISEVWLYRWTA
ncbi:MULTISPECIES: OpgD/OpgG family glucan biosynthesis protein [Phenylobacterium]|uniref:glucan biosynthesis protein n=1 Tax=Phenylobacterium TaxID=20 RepID=UPI002F94FFCE